MLGFLRRLLHELDDHILSSTSIGSRVPHEYFQTSERRWRGVQSKRRYKPKQNTASRRVPMAMIVSTRNWARNNSFLVFSTFFRHQFSEYPEKYSSEMGGRVIAGLPSKGWFRRATSRAALDLDHLLHLHEGVGGRVLRQQRPP